ncbi:hypothetical protein NDU88_003337 [Pleurodeles waltl]|uniref:Uncharacterized protein n=1 Tax=Pleurodeles waltl TaxID=8319 RepID=A0AAV7LGT7_PLEWA|nr:hypothetical protein NDU88_003337 [Pleurodeles waltl]
MKVVRTKQKAETVTAPLEESWAWRSGRDTGHAAAGNTETKAAGRKEAMTPGQHDSGGSKEKTHEEHCSEAA